MKSLPVAATLLLTACATSNPPAPAASAGKACDTAPAMRFVGQQGTVELAARLVTATGAADSRVIGPDTVVTMDYRPDRLNIIIDAQGRITGFRCG